jgi:hypothetical protein
MQTKKLFAMALAALTLSCRATVPTAPPAPTPTVRPTPVAAGQPVKSPDTKVGFDFNNRVPSCPEGDSGCAKSVFIHQYPMPKPGLLVGVEYRNDKESGRSEIPERIVLLVLRKVSGGWKVMGRATLPVDDTPPAVDGVTTFLIENPITVEKGDYFAHWQPASMPTGGIPYNPDAQAVEGLTIGKSGLKYLDVAVGKVFSDRGFVGRRDYFLNAIVKPVDYDLRGSNVGTE